MIDLNMIHAVHPIAAAGIALIYILCGGGFFGAFVLFIVLKMFGK